MQTVYLLIGIIASGKSTWARNHVDSNTFIVSKDKIREMIYGKYNYSTSDELLVDDIARSCIKSLVKQGANIIIDECWDTINNGARNRLQYYLWSLGITNIEFVYFSSIDGNVERRLKDNHGQGSKELWASVYNSMLTVFEPPYESDCLEVIDIGEENEKSN